ncbi:hypothetical protein BD408DRAFT_400783 [Parasitella parasitica]|nr:hypothetical protein BD408DRAFT_400783 [Parasitella parasitica]
MQRSLQSLSTTDATSDINGYVGRLANVRPGTILFDQNSFAIKDAKELYSLLRENVSLSAVKILFSYIDDFLYITKNKEYAVRFVNTMTTGISDFSVSVNKDKCVTNIHRDIPGTGEV